MLTLSYILHLTKLKVNYKLFIAIRYLFSKKRHNTINLITWVSMVGVAVGTAALIAVLSVLNGFENMVQDSFSAFDPSLKILPREGKSFSAKDSLIAEAKGLKVHTAWCPDYSHPFMERKELPG